MSGGTSLASPLIAALLRRSPGSTARARGWAYDEQRAAQRSGRRLDGSCPSISYICNAGVGYDGPTGIGSISGARRHRARPGSAARPSASRRVQRRTATCRASVRAGDADRRHLPERARHDLLLAVRHDDALRPAVDAGRRIGAGQSPVAVTSRRSRPASSTRPTTTGSSPRTAPAPATATTTRSRRPGRRRAAAEHDAAADQRHRPAGPDAERDLRHVEPGATSYGYQWQRSTDNGTSWTSIAGATGRATRRAAPTSARCCA